MRRKKENEKIHRRREGYVGIHSATDTEYDWGWYGKLVGAYFLDHPELTSNNNNY